MIHILSDTRRLVACLEHQNRRCQAGFLSPEANDSQPNRRNVGPRVSTCMDFLRLHCVAALRNPNIHSRRTQIDKKVFCIHEHREGFRGQRQLSGVGKDLGQRLPTVWNMQKSPPSSYDAEYCNIVSAHNNLCYSQRYSCSLVVAV